MNPQRMIPQGPSTSRRGFLKLIGGVGAGLAIGVFDSHSVAQAAAAASDSAAFAPNAFVSIGSDGRVTVMIKHLEMGQGVYTGLSTIVAEELDAAWEQMAPTGAPADAKKYNNLFWGPAQGTGGSTAIANSYMQLRQAGAAARHMLVAAAAKKWGVDASEVSVASGVVSHGENKAGFGELASLAAEQPVPEAEKLTLKDPKDFTLIGRAQPLARKDVGKTDGTATFTQDVQLPGMLVAAVAHPPRFGAKVKAFDAAKALASAGVKKVLQVPNGVAVLASDYWSAKKGRDALAVEWDESQAYRGSTDAVMSDYREKAKAQGLTASSKGDVKQAFEKAATVLEGGYDFPYLAHAAMEPLNCVVHVHDSGCDVYNGDQMQTLDQAVVAQVVGMEPAQVNIHTLFAGGSFGRRANPAADYVLEAAAIAAQVKGTPVKMVWSREDDTRAGYFRPMYHHHIKAAIDEQGQLLAWQQHIVGQSILTGTPFEGFLVKDGIDGSSVEGAANLAYGVPNLDVQLTTTNDEVKVPVLWWRSVGHTHTAFSTETMLDEMAAAAGRDPVEFRTELLKDHPRHLGVLQLAAQKADWGKPLPEGWGRGIAVHESFNSFVAQVVEVSVQDKQFKVERVVCAVDCGVAINPDVIKAQMEGGIGFGLSAALSSEITLDDGQVVQSNFHDYQVMRMNQMPNVEVHIVPSAEAPTGVGEPGTPVVAPALANALAQATGQRLRRLPLKLS